MSETGATPVLLHGYRLGAPFRLWLCLPVTS
jgi:hypothetical protein